VANRWLIVSNSEADVGAGPVVGARFSGVPPVLRSDIVGYETIRIDGLAVLPAGVDCP
jgi:hypothetical protein